MDSNGYNDSLFNTEQGFCYIHQDYCETARHEVLHGPSRQLSKYYGLWINVCPYCHNEIHKDDNGKFRFLKVKAQILFGQKYPDKHFVSIFGRNYI